MMYSIFFFLVESPKLFDEDIFLCKHRVRAVFRLSYRLEQIRERVSHKQNYREFCRISFPYPLGLGWIGAPVLPTTTITVASFAVLFIKGKEVRHIDFCFSFPFCLYTLLAASNFLTRGLREYIHIQAAEAPPIGRQKTQSFPVSERISASEILMDVDKQTRRYQRLVYYTLQHRTNKYFLFQVYQRQAENSPAYD